MTPGKYSKRSSKSFLVPQRETDLFCRMCNHIPEEVMLVDKQARIVFANRAAVKGFGVAQKVLLSGRLTDFLKDKISVKQWQKTCFMKTKNTKSPVSCTMNRVVRGNIHGVDMTVVYMPYQSKEYVLAVGRDINRKKETETRKRESEKIESFRQFIAGTTHEIQQPLKGLLKHSQSLIDRYKDRDYEYIGYKEFKDIIKTLQTMNDQVRYCFDTTDRLNILNRRKANLEDGSCGVNHVIRTTTKMLKHSLETSGIRLKLTLDPRLPQAAISTLDLSQVLSNIVTNAIQSLPSGRGTIQLKTSHQKSSDTVRIVCRDDGVGIPEEVLARVFDPFFTTKPRGLEKNSGLGLYIVYSLVKAHRGEITVKSHFRKGTAVTVELPVYHPKKKRRSQ